MNGAEQMLRSECVQGGVEENRDGRGWFAGHPGKEERLPVGDSQGGSMQSMLLLRRELPGATAFVPVWSPWDQCCVCSLSCQRGYKSMFSFLPPIL